MWRPPVPSFSKDVRTLLPSLGSARFLLDGPAAQTAMEVDRSVGKEIASPLDSLKTGYLSLSDHWAPMFFDYDNPFRVPSTLRAASGPPSFFPPTW